MAYFATVSKLKNVRPHPNADRVKLATVLGNQVVVGLNVTEDQLGVFFPSDGVLSEQFCKFNNLYRDKTKNIHPEIGGMFDNNRRVRAQRFRGEISDGFWVPLSYFDYLNYEQGFFVEHLDFNMIEGEVICYKFINEKTKQKSNINKTKNKYGNIIMFKEHFDTDNLGKNLYKIKESDVLIITEKVHGTSGREGIFKVKRELSWYERLLRYLGVSVEEYEWKQISGSRRVVLGDYSDIDVNDLRYLVHKYFKNQIRKGETFYFEIVGYEPNGRSIMSAVDLKKLNDPEYLTKFSNTGDGHRMVFKYGCADNTFDVYVYRITMTNEDGYTMDYTWDEVVRRCDELGIKYTPVLDVINCSDIVNSNTNNDFRDIVLDRIDKLAKGESIIDATHIKEGVCVRIESGNHPTIYKHKSFEFKFLEGIIKDSGVIDMEESN